MLSPPRLCHLRRTPPLAIGREVAQGAEDEFADVPKRFSQSAFAAWVVTGFALMWLRATIFRLFEAEKGALTIFSAVITAGVAALKWWGTAPA